MAEGLPVPPLGETLAWVGADLAAIEGAPIGEIHGFYVDGRSGEPAWLVARLGRRRGSRVVAVPMRGCAGAPFGAWAAYDAEEIRAAPIVDPIRPLLREHELTICEHFGIGEGVGRAAEVRQRPQGDVTATPARG